MVFVPAETRRWRAHSVATLCAAVVVAAATTLALSAEAGAYSASWQCNYYSAQTCWAGDGYHSWIVITNSVAYVRYNVCAKGRTEAGNTRTGSGDGCNTNATNRRTCFSYEYPLSAAYVYWAGNGSQMFNFGNAWTPSENPAGC